MQILVNLSTCIFVKNSTLPSLLSELLKRASGLKMSRIYGFPYEES